MPWRASACSSPRRARSAVEPTMSVKTTVAVPACSVISGGHLQPRLQQPAGPLLQGAHSDPGSGLLRRAGPQFRLAYFAGPAAGEEHAGELVLRMGGIGRAFEPVAANEGVLE